MGYREAQELARIRYELRQRLLSHHYQGVGGILDRLLAVAEDGCAPMPELRGEYTRWRLRFALLDASG